MPIWSLPRAPKVGDRVHHFRILSKLGEGGMGDVYEAFDETLERKVALKSVRPSHALDDMARERFLREARTLSALDHPGICRIHDYVRSPEGDFLVLELLQGRTLHEEIAAGPPRARALDLGEQLTAVLAAAHEAGIVHRDLKPGNVMVTPEGRVKVLDFGLSRREGTEEERAPGASAAGDREALRPPPDEALRTSPGTVLGTLPYMSPEQARGEPVSAATDLFALGLILQELLTGRPARPRDLDFTELHERVSEGRVDVAPSLGRELGGIVRALTRVEPDARPRAEEVLARLRWIRTRPRRVLRRSLAAALLLAGGLGWLKYTVDLRRRERQAEDLIDYLVVELRPKLESVGRLDILGDLGERALAYFAAVPERDWTEAELTKRCKAFYQLGDVFSQQGDRARAREFFLPALAFAEELVRRDAGNREWLFELGQLQFYVGQVHYDLDEFAEARPWWERYLATSRRLLELDPRRAEYRMEVAYGLTNVGSLALKERRWAEAGDAFDEVVGVWRTLAGEFPDDADLRMELADALSWRAESLKALGDPPAAIAAWREELAIREELHRLDPANARWEYLRSTALHNLARVLFHAGELEEAGELRARAVALARELCARDPSNADWRRHLAVALVQRGQALRSLGRNEESEGACAEALELLDALLAIDPSNGDWQGVRAQARLALGAAQAAAGRPDAALATAAAALDGLAPEQLTPGLAAQAHLVTADALRAAAREDGERAELERALVALEQPPPDARDQQSELMRVEVLARLERRAEAAALLAQLEARGMRSTTLSALVAGPAPTAR